MQETDATPAAVVPPPDGPPGVSWHRIDAARTDDAHAIARRIAEVEEPGVPIGRSEMDRRLEAAGRQDRTLLGARDGVPVAYGLVTAAGAIRLPGGVLPEARGAGIGRRLLAWQAAQALAVRGDRDVPITVRQPTLATRTAALLARAGFRPERTFLHLRRPGSPVQRSALTAGLRAVHFDRRFDEPVRIAKNRTFEDHWRSTPEDSEQWARHHLGPWLRRDLSRIAVTADDRVAGFVVAWEPDEAPDETYVALVGTDPDRRGQGIARALLTEVVAAAAAAGRPVVTLEVDAESPTGADRLYASIGFERVLEAVVHGLPA